MKRKIIIDCLLVFIWQLALPAKAQESQPSSQPSESTTLTGGIVYSDGKNAVYQELATGKTTNLTDDIEKPITGPVGISENGEILVWLQDGEFWLRKTPDGKSLVITVDAIDEKETKRLKALLLQPRNIKRIIISPKNDYIAYESYNGEIGWFQIPQKEVKNEEKISSKISIQKDTIFPVWWKDYSSDAHLPLRRKDSPPAPKEIISPILVYINKTTGQYGPIVIRGVKTDNPNLLTNWEIPVSLTNCGGLACKPNGEFTYFSGGTMFHFNLNLIGTLIDKNLPNKEPTEEEFNELSGRFTPEQVKEAKAISKKAIIFAVGDIIFIKRGSIAAQGIIGTNFHWVSNETLIFRGFDGTLYSRTQKQAKYEKTVDAQGRPTYKPVSPAPPPEKKKLLDKVPLLFSYCKYPPIAENKKTETSPQTQKTQESKK